MTIIKDIARFAETEAASIQGRLAIDWDAMVEYLVPVGYEDETGFHYGWPMRADLGNNNRAVVIR